MSGRFATSTNLAPKLPIILYVKLKDHVSSKHLSVPCIQPITLQHTFHCFTLLLTDSFYNMMLTQTILAICKITTISELTNHAQFIAVDVTFPWCQYDDSQASTNGAECKQQGKSMFTSFTGRRFEPSRSPFLR